MSLSYASDNGATRIILSTGVKARERSDLGGGGSSLLSRYREIFFG